tara:strand:- start:231 stop:374 length:144 start_codon:yes stop_codon:yes gene_type:complete
MVILNFFRKILFLKKVFGFRSLGVFGVFGIFGKAKKVISLFRVPNII